MKPDLDPRDADWLELNHAQLMEFRRRMAEGEARKHSPLARLTRFVVGAFVVIVFTLLCVALAISNLPPGGMP